MAHLTQAQIEELGIKYKMLAESATTKGLNANLHISMYNSPKADDIFDAVSLRVDKDGDEDSLFWDSITISSSYGWRKLELAFEEAEQIVNEYQA